MRWIFIYDLFPRPLRASRDVGECAEKKRLRPEIKKGVELFV